MLLNNPLKACCNTSLLLSVDVFRSNHSDKNFEKLKSNECTVIVTILILFLVVCCRKSNFKDSGCQSLIEQLCLLAELHKLELADIWWRATFGYDLKEHVF